MLQHTPITTCLIAVYLGMAMLTGFLQADLDKLIAYGGAVPALVATGEPWRLLTCAFLHGGILHLGFNTLALMQLGPALEIRLGSVRFAILYVVTAVGGSVAGILSIAPFESIFPLTPLVGGSGALFGMLGALVAGNLRANRSLLDFFEDGPSRSLMTLIGVNLLIGFLIPFISNSAHIGGLLTGFALTFWFFDLGRGARTVEARTSRTHARALVIVCLAAWTTYVVFPVLRWDYQLSRGWYTAVAINIGGQPADSAPGRIESERRAIRNAAVQMGWNQERARRIADRLTGQR